MNPLRQWNGRPLPFSYRWLVGRGLTNFGAWYFVEGQAESDGLRKEFLAEIAEPNPSPIRDIQPFARAGTDDDIAGFEIREGRVVDKVVVVHLTWAIRTRPERDGFPWMVAFGDIWEWLAEFVVPELKVVAEQERKYYEGERRSLE